MAILDFSVSGWHGFGSVTQVCFGISVSNFMCMSIVAVGRSLRIVSYVAFKIAALWFWTMFNCNPPIAHCHPLLWGGGILVDHWSTISSWFRWCLGAGQATSHYLNQWWLNCRRIYASLGLNELINVLLPGSLKSLPEPMSTYNWRVSLASIWGKFHLRYLNHQ